MLFSRRARGSASSSVASKRRCWTICAIDSYAKVRGNNPRQSISLIGNGRLKACSALQARLLRLGGSNRGGYSLRPFCCLSMESKMLIKERMLAGLLAVSSPAALASVAPAPAAQEASDAQETAEYAEEAAAEVEAHEADRAAEELLASLHFQHGKIVLGDNLATLDLPEQFVYLNGADAELVLTKGWGNPPSEPSLGMILPAGVSPLADES